MEATSNMPFDDRYSRQALFARVGDDGQRRIGAGKVLLVGCGGLGTAALNLLVRAGVGEITVVDQDRVEASNLARQLLFEEADVGTPKALAGARAAGRINSAVSVTPVVAHVGAENIVSLATGMDVVVDATDNLATRYLINDACVSLGIPWVYGGVIGSTGMTMTLVPGETACFRCLFPVSGPDAIPALPTCASVGVLSGAVVIVAARQWTETIKLLIGDREHLNRAISYIDVWSNDLQDGEPVAPVPDCPCCAQRRFEFLNPQS